MQKVVAGIDIGGTNTKYGLVDESGKILMHGNINTTQFDKVEEFAKSLCDTLNEEAKKLSSVVLKGIGIGSPNGNYYSGTIEFAPNLKWKGVIPLAQLFMGEVNLPAVLTNDAKAAALGEMIFGGARNMKHFLFITLGTGLGSGIVVDGKLVYGHDGFAGELGHTIMFENGRQCGCGRKGCLEQYASATGIVKTYIEIMNESGNSLPVTSEKLNGKFIFEQAQSGDRQAQYAFHYTGEILGLALANACCYTSPEAIFLFGGLAQNGEIIFKPTRESFEKNLLKVYKGKIKILPSALKESDAAILGAASLIWSELKRYSPEVHRKL